MFPVFKKIGVSNPVCLKFDLQKHQVSDGAPSAESPLHFLDMEAGLDGGPFLGNLGRAENFEIEIASTGHVNLPSANMSLVMMNSDLLGRILCSFKASQATIDTLIWMKRVSKLWPIIVKGMLVDRKWMAPFIESGDLFVNDIYTIGWISVDSWVDVQFDDTVFSNFLEQMQMHSWHEAVQYHGIVALSPSDLTTTLDVSAEHLELLLYVSNNAMAIHRKSLRVQNAALSLLDFIFLNNVASVAMFHQFDAVSGVTRALRNFGDGTTGIAIVEKILSAMTVMLETKDGFMFQNNFRLEGAIELLIKYMSKSDCLDTIEISCLKIIMHFNADYVPFIRNCGFERVIFIRMKQHSFDIVVQTECLCALVWCYILDSPVLCTFQDLSPLNIIFDATEKFKLEDSGKALMNNGNKIFFKTCIHLFSILMANRDNFQVHDEFVHRGYVEILVSKMQQIVKNGPNEPKDEEIYAHITQILSRLAMFRRLHTSVACPNIKLVLEGGMHIFSHNADVLLATCNLFRLIFFVPCQVRRPTPALSLVKLVLDAISENPTEYLLAVECVLTLDLLVDSRQVLNFVSQNDGSNIIATIFNWIIGSDSMSVPKRKMGLKFSHILQSEFVQASFSLLNKLPLCAPSKTSNIFNVLLVRAVMQAIRQHKTDANIQNGALHTLDKYIIPHSHLHRRFRMDTGLLMCSAIELPDLSSESRAIAQRLLFILRTSGLA